MPADCAHPEIEQTYLGEDPRRGRFADVHLKRCPACGARWLHYHFVYEGFTGSGRWYEARLTDAQARAVTAETAAALLESLPSYQAGGSWFGGEVQTRSGPLLDTP
jgi:hypothetical protein